jgi:hypothetical protein
LHAYRWDVAALAAHAALADSAPAVQRDGLRMQRLLRGLAEPAHAA